MSTWNLVRLMLLSHRLNTVGLARDYVDRSVLFALTFHIDGVVVVFRANG
jgi:hypothetical protein